MIDSISSTNADNMSNLRALMFDRWDKDEDGELSSAEIKNLLTDISGETGQSLSMEDFLSTLDSSGNGTIDAEELQGLREVSGPPSGAEDLGGPPPETAGAGAPLPPGGGGMFSDLDEDERDFASQSELLDFLNGISEKSGASFDVSDVMSQLDADGDGALSKEEAAGLKNILGPPPDESGSFAMKNGVHMEAVSELYSRSSQPASA